MTGGAFGRVGVVGLGTMGTGIAEVIARGGVPVVGIEISEDALARGRGHLEKSTGRAVKRGRLTAEAQAAILERVTLSTSFDSLSECDLVIEAVPERLELKRRVFGELDKVCRADAVLATNTIRARAILQDLPPHVVVAGRSAAWIWGYDVLPLQSSEEDWPIDLIADQPVLPPPNSTFREADLPPTDITSEKGIRLTTRERTALDCARFLPRMEAVAAVDRFLRSGLDLSALKQRARPKRRTREVLSLTDPGAHLPGESWTRCRILEAGLPRPTTQIPIPGPADPDFYLDMGYEQHRTAIEYDGERFHTTAKARAHDATRRAWIKSQHGWEILVVTKEDILYNPAPFLEALTTTLMHRGWNPTPTQMSKIERYVTRQTRRRKRRY
jgi:3-hydroxyacyl-CoA dehydrogenase-like protein